MYEEFANEWVVEGGLVVTDEGVFHCSGFGFCGLYGHDNGGEQVVVEVLMPPPDCKFTLSWNVLQELTVFGNAVGFSAFHVLGGRSNVHVLDNLRVNQVW